jgi:hypothetical protein
MLGHVQHYSIRKLTIYIHRIMTTTIRCLKCLETTFSESNACASWVAACPRKVVQPVRGDGFVSPSAILIDYISRADRSNGKIPTPFNPCMPVSSSLNSVALPFLFMSFRPFLGLGLAAMNIGNSGAAAVAPQAYAKPASSSYTISTPLGTSINETSSLVFNPFLTPANGSRLT